MILEAEQAREFYEEKYKSNNNENVSIGSGKDKFLFTRLFLFAVKVSFRIWSDNKYFLSGFVDL